MSPSSSPPLFEQELDRLCSDLEGAVYRDALGEAKAACGSQDYRRAAQLVSSTWALYRERRWGVLRHQPENPGAPSAADRHLAAAKAKAEEILRRFETLLAGLNRMAAQQPEGKPAGLAPPGGLPVECPAAKGGVDQPEAAGANPELRREGPKVALLDMGSFTQLLMAAQQTDFAVNTDAIISARDRDYRRGNYRKAFGVIEGLSKRFETAAQQRVQTLAQEDIAYRSGTLKMSPKEWQAKLRRDRVKTLIIERTERYFKIVLNGLAVMAAQAEEEKVSGTVSGGNDDENNGS